MGRRMDGRKTAWFLLLVGDDYDSLCNKKCTRRGEVLKDVMDLPLLLFLLLVLVQLSCDRPTCVQLVGQFREAQTLNRK